MKGEPSIPPLSCEDVERDEIAERYLRGELSSAAQERFEAHYFDCTPCLERLRVLEELHAELSRPVASPRGASRWWRVAAAGLAAAAVIVLAVRVAQNPATSDVVDPRADAPARAEDVTLPPPPPTAASAGADLARLGAVEPPTYTPLQLRGTATDATREFRAAMERYAAGDYAAATPGLRRALAHDEALIQARFFLAVCELQAGRNDEAAQELQRVIARGESPYLEEAHFLLAKARIRQGDVAAARAELARVVALDGDRRREATQLLAQLPER
jgi:tetratricopeptide (TPR) repeat protein